MAPTPFPTFGFDAKVFVTRDEHASGDSLVVEVGAGGNLVFGLNIGPEEYFPVGFSYRLGALVGKIEIDILRQERIQHHHRDSMRWLLFEVILHYKDFSQTINQVGLVLLSKLMLPDTHDTPSTHSQFSVHQLVSRNVSF